MTTNLQDILDQTGAEADRPGQWTGHCPNPAHDDNKPSFRIAWDGERVLMHCLSGCDQDDFMGGLGVSSFREITVDEDTIAAQPNRIKSPTLTYPGDPGNPEAQLYAKSRWGIDDQDFERFGLTGDGDSLIIPFMDEDGMVNTYQRRFIDEDAPYRWKSAPGSHPNLGFFRGVDDKALTLVVAEGPSDALAVAVTGYSVVFSSGVQYGDLTDWLEQHQFEFNHVVLAGDADHAGSMRDMILNYGLTQDPDAPRHPSLATVDWGGEHLQCISQPEGYELLECTDLFELHEEDGLESFIETSIHNPDSNAATEPVITNMGGWRIVDFPPSVVIPEIPDPELLTLSDGSSLLYPGESHSLYGEPESGKTWLALYAMKQEIEKGNSVVLIDAEDRWEKSYRRMIQLGTDPHAVSEHFRYIKPMSPTELEEVAYVLQAEPTLIVIDSTGESMGIEGFDQNADGDVAQWNQRLVHPLTVNGACVLTLDHVVKSADGKGRWAIGSQRKLASITGAAYTVTVQSKWSRQDIGHAKVECTKDRNGKIPRGHDAAKVIVAPTTDGEGIMMKLDPGVPKGREMQVSKTSSRIEEDILNMLEQTPDGVLKSVIIQTVTGGNVRVASVLESLIEKGTVLVEQDGATKTCTMGDPSEPKEDN